MVMAMRRIVCAALLAMCIGVPLRAMPVASRGNVARQGAIVAGGTLTPEAASNLRWAGISITVYCILTHRFGM